MRVRRRSSSGVPARRGARPGRCPARPGEDGQGGRGHGEARRGRARCRAEAPCGRGRAAGRPQPRRRRTPDRNHATANCACGMRGHCALFLRNPKASRELFCRVFCQVTGFSRPGNRDKHAHRLPAAPPGVMVVQTAGKPPAITRNNRGREPRKRSHAMPARKKNTTQGNAPHSATHTAPSPQPAPAAGPRPAAPQRPSGPR